MLWGTYFVYYRNFSQYKKKSVTSVLNQIVRYCNEKNINVVRYSTQVIDEQEKPVSKIYLQPLFENSIESYYRKFIGENRGSLSEFIFRYSQYKKYKFKDYPLAWTSDDRAIIDFSERCLPQFYSNQRRSQRTEYVACSWHYCA